MSCDNCTKLQNDFDYLKKEIELIKSKLDPPNKTYEEDEIEKDDYDIMEESVMVIKKNSDIPDHEVDAINYQNNFYKYNRVNKYFRKCTNVVKFVGSVVGLGKLFT